MEKQAAPVYEQFGLTIPVITSSTLCIIAEYKKASLLKVTSALKISHQLAAQRVKTLLQLGIVCTEKDQRISPDVAATSEMALDKADFLAL